MAFTVLCGPVAFSAQAAPHVVPGPCEETVPKIGGPAWVHLSLRVAKLVSVRTGGPKNTPVQLPVEDIAEFDGYVPVDGSNISFGSGRETAYVDQMSSTARLGKPAEISLRPGSVFMGVSGTFHALPTSDGKVLVTPDITLTSDLIMGKRETGDLEVELPVYKSHHIDTPLIIKGLRCSAHLNLPPVQIGARSGQVHNLYSFELSAYRTQ